ncbi:MAG: hypothetical protein ACE5IG_06485, partial [Dehalococcoidia bacterium]
MRFRGTLPKSWGRLTLALVAAVVLAVLLLAQPVSAVQITVDSLPSSIDKGDRETFFINVAIETSERIPINDMDLTIDGPTPVTATVLPTCAVVA